MLHCVFFWRVPVILYRCPCFLAQDAQGSSCLSTVISSKSPGLENGILKIRSVCIVCTLLLDLSMDRAREYVFVYTSVYIEIFSGSKLYVCVCLFLCVHVIHKHTHKHTHSISMKLHWYLHLHRIYSSFLSIFTTSFSNMENFGFYYS